MKELLRQAQHLLESGRADQAAAVLDDALSREPDHPVALQLRAQAAHRVGQLATAESLLRRAAESASASWVVFNNLGNVLRETGRLDEAEAALRKASAMAPDSATAAFNLANTLVALGRADEAEALYRRATAAEPGHAAAWRGLGIVLGQQGRRREAADAYRHVFELAPEDPTACNDLGATLLELGELAEAQRLLARACRLAPQSPQPFCNLGIVLMRAMDYHGAVRAFDEALRLDPAMTRAAAYRGRALLDMGDEETAIAALEEAVANFPNDADLRLALAECQEQRHRLDAARDTANWLLSHAGNRADTRALAARLHRREGDSAAALRIMEDVPTVDGDDEAVARWQTEYGRILDELGRYEDAFERFTRANEHFARAPGFQNLNSDGYWKWLRNVRERLDDDWASALPRLKPEGTPPVFLVGFPRSGTTLAERILDAHPAIGVLGEQPPLELTVTRCRERCSDYPIGLRNQDPARLIELRDYYEQQVDRFVRREDYRVLVDKNPMSLVHVPFILQLYPHAGFVFVQRHPCDAVLSGYMQSFTANVAMASFLTLEDGAHLFDECLLLWQRYLGLLDPRVLVLKYEALLEDFETSVQQLLEFVGVAWDDRVRAFDRHARAGQRIRTPSYSQVTQPIFTTSRGRWRNYEKQLAPVLDLLTEHARRLGY